ncbi:MAG: hypothetical protein IJV40_09270 [Oscillospiraceae bacterium]|nr:hypothetical protein [Oscillospiraceae bacterium]
MERKESDVLKPAKIGAILLAVAVIVGVLVMVLSSPRSVKAEPEPTPTAAPVVPTAPTPAPKPEITAIRLYAFGRELDDGGITLYVGDRPVELYADIEPAGTGLSVEWSFSNEEAVSLEISDDGLKCTVTVLQAKGKNELKVVCNNLYTAIPVYLWER